MLDGRIEISCSFDKSLMRYKMDANLTDCLKLFFHK